ncbi:hypothetical protein NHQ30_002103 [Ciborinia camelliae]|nr:hypothetical protein NHQ30_002103 [Ciborinia camelliae]
MLLLPKLGWLLIANTAISTVNAFDNTTQNLSLFSHWESYTRSREWSDGIVDFFKRYRVQHREMKDAEYALIPSVRRVLREKAQDDEAEKELQSRTTEWTAGVVETFNERGVPIEELTEAEYELIREITRDRWEPEKNEFAWDVYTEDEFAWNEYAGDENAEDEFAWNEYAGDENAEDEFAWNEYVGDENAEDEYAEDEHDKWYKIKWEDLPDIIKEWIDTHPLQTAFFILKGAAYFVPAGECGAILSALGFAPKGQRAGK